MTVKEYFSQWSVWGCIALAAAGGIEIYLTDLPKWAMSVGAIAVMVLRALPQAPAAPKGPPSP